MYRNCCIVISTVYGSWIQSAHWSSAAERSSVIWNLDRLSHSYSGEKASVRVSSRGELWQHWHRIPSHAKPLRRDSISEKVLNYLTKLATGTAKIPTSQRKTEETSSQKSRSQIFFTWRRQQRAQSRTI